MSAKGNQNAELLKMHKTKKNEFVDILAYALLQG